MPISLKKIRIFRKCPQSAFVSCYNLFMFLCTWVAPFQPFNEILLVCVYIYIYVKLIYVLVISFDSCKYCKQH